MSSFEGNEKEGHSKEARMKLYREGWYVIKHHPFGVGVGNFREVANYYFKDPMDQHCLYTETLSEIGIQGFIVFIFLLNKIYNSLNNTRKQLIDLIAKLQAREKYDSKLKKIIYDAKLTHAVIQATMVYFLLRLFLDIFGMDLYGICWWFIIGISSSSFLILYNLKERLLEYIK